MNQETANSTKNQKHLWKKFKDQTDRLDELRSEESTQLQAFVEVE